MDKLSAFWRRLTDAPVAVTDSEARQKIRLLSGLLLVMVAIAAVDALLRIAFLPAPQVILGVLLPLVVILTAAYKLAHAGWHRTASVITLAVAISASVAAVLSEPDDIILYAYLGACLLLASLLFSEVGIWVTAAVSLLIVLVLQPTLGVPLPGGDLSLPALLTVTAALLLISTRHRNVLERARRSELEASENRFRDYFQTSPVVMAITRVQGGRFRDANRAFEHWSGWSRAETVNRTSAELGLWTAAEREQVVQQLVREGSVRNLEVRMRTRGGELRDVLASLEPLRMDNEDYVLITAVDITERKRAEEDTHRLNRLLATLAAVNPLMVRISTETELFRGICRTLVEQGEFSMAWVGLVGAGSTNVEVVCQSGFQDGYLENLAIRCDDTPAGQGPTGTAIRTGITVVNDDTETNERFVPWRERAREHGYRSSIALPLRVEGVVVGSLNVYAKVPHAFGKEEVLLLEALVSDIGLSLERRRATAHIESSEHELATILRNMQDTYYRTDTDGRIVRASESASQLLGYSPSEVVKQDLTGFYVEPDGPERFIAALKAAGGVLRNYEVALRHRDGSVLWVSTNSQFIYDENGKVIGVEGTVRNVTERKQAELALRESQEMLNKAQEVAHIGSWWQDVPGNRLLCSRELLRLYGLPSDINVSTDEMWQRIFQAVHPDDRERLMQNVQDSLTPGRAIEPFEYRAIWPDGQERTLLAYPEVLRGTDGQPLATYGAVQDITERKRAENQMLKLSGAIEQTADSVMITDRQGVIEYVNPAFEHNTGFTAAEALGQTPRLVRSGRQGQVYYKNLWETILDGEVFSDVIINRRKDGTLYYEEKTITPLKDAQGQVTHFISTGKDVTERMQVQEKLTFMAQHDALTELPNRALLLDRLKQSVLRSRWHHRTTALLFIDLDRFKTINDTLGHEMGDQLLRHLGDRFSRSVREGDTVARFGGDEFVILLDDVANTQDINGVAQKVLDALKAPFEIGHHALYITASIGISLYPNDGEDGATLLKHADIAMYRAKELGKNTYQFYSADMSARAFERLSLETSLRHALQRQEFVLHYQPQIDVSRNKVVGVEALLRWQHPDFGLVPPVDFIALLEETGLIVQAGEWVLTEAGRQLRLWHEAGYRHLRMAVNLSPRQMQTSGFLAGVEHVLASGPDTPGWLELEITEGLLVEQSPVMMETFDALRTLGVRLAVDDFGTGYSSLSYLRRLPIDTLKVDRSFVRDVPGDADDSAIATTIIAMAQSLRLEVIAEGVENSEQRDFLSAYGCRRMQGYLFSKPLPAAELSALLANGGSIPAPV